MTALLLAMCLGMDPSPQVIRLTRRATYEYNADDFGQAFLDYQAAYELQPFPELLFDMGQAQRGLHHWSRAEFLYKRYLAVKPRARNREKTEKLIAMVQEKGRALAGAISAGEAQGQPPPGVAVGRPGGGEASAAEAGQPPPGGAPQPGEQPAPTAEGGQPAAGPGQEAQAGQQQQPAGQGPEAQAGGQAGQQAGQPAGAQQQAPEAQAPAAAADAAAPESDKSSAFFTLVAPPKPSVHKRHRMSPAIWITGALGLAGLAGAGGVGLAVLCQPDHITQGPTGPIHSLTYTHLNQIDSEGSVAVGLAIGGAVVFGLASILAATLQ